MRRNIDKIEIQDPPIQELGKKRSCLKRTCFTGCGCIIIFVLLALLIIKFVAGPRVKEMKSLPENFPASIPIYDKDSINKISFISGRQKNRGIEIAAYVPKFILSPVILLLDRNINPDKANIQTSGQKIAETSWNGFTRLISEPITDQRDIWQIEWTGLQAEPKFIQEYFASELKKHNFKIDNETVGEKIRQFSFINKDENIDGVIYILDEPSIQGTDYLSLTANIPVLLETK